MTNNTNPAPRPPRKTVEEYRASVEKSHRTHTLLPNCSLTPRR